MDFTQTPPGMLALDNMLYLAKVHQDTYIRVSSDLRRDAAPLKGARRSHVTTPLYSSKSWQIVLENSSREDKHECPFGRCAIDLTRILCEILQVGELRKLSAVDCGGEMTSSGDLGREIHA